ncbi:hypothetical protein BH11MYX3_BH11MYX3_01920 [soil metagenome]
MLMRAPTTRCLVALLLMFAACGDDGVHHLADAPAAPDDGGEDASIDAPGSSDVELALTLAGGGSGTVTSSPAGITCGAECTASFAKDTVVTLTAAPATGSVFGGWSGGCTGTLPTCDVTLATAATVTATFNVATYTVTVTRAGAGAGTVSGNGLACGATCTITVDHGTVLSLTAAPGALSTFAGWGGGCSGSGTCMMTVTGTTAITANFALDNLTLFVTRGGNGTGTVTSSPAGISCGADCSETYVANQMITLTAAPSTGSTFTGWSGGGCSGTGTCVVTMTAAITVTATFTLTTHALTVTRAGNGSGAVTSNPAGIACGADCSETYNYGTMVTLTATPSTGSTFTTWGGACTGTGPCVVTMTQASAVTATFTLDTHALTVSKLGTGAGLVTGTGISCGADCGEILNYGTMVTLTATASTGSTFAGWSGACAGGGTCTVTMDMARSVTATFTLNTFTLAVSKLGNGTGNVTGTGISCGADCSEVLGYGTVVTLTASPSLGSSFTGWTGACNGTGTCTVTMDMARSATATFTLDTFTLTVAASGNGTVTGTGINCPGDCSETFNYGTMVTLTPNPGTGSSFTGWSGSCTGSGACTVAMTAIRSVTATFAVDTFLLGVAPGGTGAGTITGTGINCPGDCSETFAYNTMVTLSAAPAMSSTFTGWSAPCSGTGTCTVTMDMARTVTATFTLKKVTLTVTESGSGVGTVTGTGISCQSDCSEEVDYGTTIALTATPSSANATASEFNTWSGGCSGGAGCSVTLTADTTVNASFTLLPNLMFVTSTVHTGDLGGLSGADSICKGLAQAANRPGNYVAYLSTLNGNTTINAPSRVGSAKGWIRVDGKPVMNSITEFPAGNLFSPPSLTERGLDVGQTQTRFVWTGTSVNGTHQFGCGDGSMPWASTSGSGVAGDALSTTSTAVISDGTGTCDRTYRLYCLGIDRTAIAQ